VRDDEDALFVVLHEVLHRVMGHLQPGFARRLPASMTNLVCDIAVNAQLARLAFPRGPRVLSRLYDARVYPTNLLLAPPQLLEAFGACELADSVPALAARVRDRIQRRRLARVLAKGFRNSGCPIPSVAADRYLRAWLEEEGVFLTLDAWADFFAHGGSVKSRIVRSSFPW
jgi:hypothetical protein